MTIYWYEVYQFVVRVIWQVLSISTMWKAVV